MTTDQTQTALGSILIAEAATQNAENAIKSGRTDPAPYVEKAIAALTDALEALQAGSSVYADKTLRPGLNKPTDAAKPANDTKAELEKVPADV